MRLKNRVMGGGRSRHITDPAGNEFLVTNCQRVWVFPGFLEEVAPVDLIAVGGRTVETRGLASCPCHANCLGKTSDLPQPVCPLDVCVE